MAGGNFDINVGKKRPGAYVNTKSKKQQKPSGSTRGIVVLPIVGYDWGPDAQFIKISAESPDGEIVKLGRSVYDDNDSMLLIRECLKNAITCYVYIINGGARATATAEGLTITAAYGGTRGNDIKVACVANTAGGFDVTVYLGTEAVENFKGVNTVADLIAASKGEYVVFSAQETSAALVAFASTALTGGTNAESSNAGVSTFLDKSENVKWNTMCFPIEDDSLQTACQTKIKYLRENAGKWVQAVMPSCSSDYEGIINVTNAVVLEDGKVLTVAQACAWVAGATAGATKTDSITYKAYEGAIEVSGVKTNEESVLAIQNGEFFFTVSEEGKVVVEYDINSLHTFTPEKTSDYAKNRVMRVYDSFAEDLALTFPPNKYDNGTEGWLVMEGLGRALLQNYADAGAIDNVDLDNDFYVDQSRSAGDETYFNVGLQAIDSAEKLYFSVSTR